MSRPRFCYVLTTDGRDEHVDMTFVSAAFLREVHPEAEIVVLCDEPSRVALERSGHPLRGLVDRVEGVETPQDAPAGHRNRFVKTRMRLVLEGDFVYFDADTLVVGRLDEMLECPAPVAGIPNHSGSGGADTIPTEERLVFERMGWALPERSYINGGVLLLRDTDDSRRFSALWHEKWLSWSRHGRHNDQQTLNSALADSGVWYEALDCRFNAQVSHFAGVASDDVAVWHFYVSDHDINRTILHEAIRRFRSGRLDPASIGELRSWPYPWRTDTALDRRFARRVVRAGHVSRNSPELLWLKGYRLKAARLLLARRLRWQWTCLKNRLTPPLADPALPLGNQSRPQSQ